MEILAKIIDHTLLRPDASQDQIEQLVTEAIQYGFASVCINPCWVELAAHMCKGSSVKVCTVVGFPLGAATTEVKAYEASVLIDKGAQEIDMVINIGFLKSKNPKKVFDDIFAVVRASKDCLVKVIIETCLLTDEEKIEACLIAKKAGAHFVKTSTGFSSKGAQILDVALMRKTVGDSMGIKASGGIKDKETAYAMIKAGATRLGTSSGVKIISS